MVLGISMAFQQSRRLLVAVTYEVMLAMTATVIVILPSGRQIDAIWWCLLLFYNVVSRAIFGRLVKDTVLPQPQVGLTSLGLEPQRRRSEDEPDEREVAVRNAAYFGAFRVLAVYSIVLWVAAPCFFSLRPEAGIRGLMLLAMPLLAMALTLPQAILLWNEPDVPEEARV
jgi:hypothetical protein